MTVLVYVRCASCVALKVLACTQYCTVCYSLRVTMTLMALYFTLRVTIIVLTCLLYSTCTCYYDSSGLYTVLYNTVAVRTCYYNSSGLHAVLYV